MSTTISTPSVFYKLPKELICRNSFSSNINHFIYREIQTKPSIQMFVRERIKESLMNVYKVSKEQHIKRYNSDSDLLMVENMFPCELVNPEKFKKEQEEKAWRMEQTKRLREWRESYLAKEFIENKMFDGSIMNNTENHPVEMNRPSSIVSKKIFVNKPCCI